MFIAKTNIVTCNKVKTCRKPSFVSEYIKDMPHITNNNTEYSDVKDVSDAKQSDTYKKKENEPNTSCIGFIISKYFILEILILTDV